MRSGNAPIYSTPFGNILESTGDVNNNIKYAGYQYDEETELYYLNARMYDPKVARFLQEDTYRGDPRDPLSLNLYAYCANNPITYYDPTGHAPAVLRDIAMEYGYDVGWDSSVNKAIISKDDKEHRFSGFIYNGTMYVDDQHFLYEIGELSGVSATAAIYLRKKTSMINLESITYGGFVLGTHDTPYSVSYSNKSAGMLDAMSKSDNLYNSKETGSFFSISGVLTRQRLAFIEDRAWANIVLGGIALPDAADFLKHFIRNSGEDYEADFSRMLKQSSYAHAEMKKDINLAMDAAEHFAVDGSAVNIVSKEEAYKNRGNTMSMNWYFSVGNYSTWTRASVTKEGELYSMSVEYNLRDFYNWKTGSDAFGGFVVDGEMAELHAYGRAKEFEVYGTHNITMTWAEGERYDVLDSKSVSHDRSRRNDRMRRQRPRIKDTRR